MNRYRICIALLIILVIATSAQAQLEDTEDGPSKQDFLEDAGTQLDAFEFGSAIEIINDGLNSLLPDDPDFTELRLKAFTLRSVAHFNLNQLAETRQDFQEIFKIKPDHQLDSPYVSQQMMDIWQEVRDETIGSITVKINPANATVIVNDESVDILEDPQVNLVAGLYTISVAAPDFGTRQQDVMVKPGESVPVTIELERVASSLRLQTIPAGVSILVNGEKRGETVIDEMNPASQVSAPLEIHDLQPGNYELTLVKDCYRIKISAMTISKLGEFFIYEPFVLERETAQIALPPLPPLSTVIVNGKQLTRDELDNAEVCPGKPMTIEIRSLFGNGHLQLENVEADKTYGENISLQPTLISSPAYDLEQRSFRILESPPEFNFSNLLNSKESNQHKLRLGALIDTAINNDLSSRTIQLSGDQFKMAQNLLSRHGTFFLRTPLIKDNKVVAVLLLNALYPFAEVITDQTREQGDTDLEWHLAGWTGVELAMLPMSGDLFVTATYPGGPADEAGLKKGDYIREISGVELESSLDLNQINGVPANSEILLQIERGDEIQRVRFTVASVPVLVTSPGYLAAPITTKLARLLLENELDQADRLDQIVQYNIALLLARSGLQTEAIRQLNSLPGDIRKTGQFSHFIQFQIAKFEESLGNTDEAQRIISQILKEPHGKVYNGHQQLPLSRVLALSRLETEALEGEQNE